MTDRIPPYRPGGAHRMIASLNQAAANPAQEAAALLTAGADAARDGDRAAAAAAIELAYGLLWLLPTDPSTKAGCLAFNARQALLPHLDRDAKMRGVQAAMKLMAELESRKKPATE